MQVAIGLKARTGRAALVALAGTATEPCFVDRAQLPLLPEGAFAPYHAAEGLPAAEARRFVRRSIAAAQRLAASGIRSIMKRLSAGGHDLCGCGILVGSGMPAWTTEEILAVHVRMHKAEGELFRDVLVDGAHACRLHVSTLPEKTAFDAAAEILGVPRTEIDRRITALGKAAGPPWTKDQKEAAAAALVALARVQP